MEMQICVVETLVVVMIESFVGAQVVVQLIAVTVNQTVAQMTRVTALVQ